MIKYFCFLMCILSSVTAFAQPLKQVEVIEPTAASLAKYGTYPVNYSTGLPGISIPLYTIKSGELSLDLALSYHGGGVKLNEDASWVGLGWDLFAGGSITRQVYGLPDEFENFSSVVNADNILSSMRGANRYNFNNSIWDAYAAGTMVGSEKQDVYSFNLGGYSGTFVLDNNNQPMLIPYSSVKVIGTPSTGFTIVVPNGTKYEFTQGDMTYDIGSQGSGKVYCSTWNVVRITSANNTDTIAFEYQDDGWITNASQTYFTGVEYSYEGCLTSPVYKGGRILPLTGSASGQKVEAKKIASISFKEGKVLFYLSDRNDIFTDQLNVVNINGIITPTSPKSIKKLDKVVVERLVNAQLQTLKTFNFTYTYFTANQAYNDSRFHDRVHPNCLRLKLEAVEMEAETERMAVASMQYYEEHPFAPKFSFSTDYWGYYNGKSSETPIPLSVVNIPSNPSGQMLVGGADKTPNEAYLTTGSLRSLTYPTGGQTVFSWEENSYSAEKPTVMLPEMKTETAYSSSDTHLYHDTPSHIEGSGVSFDSWVNQNAELHYSVSLQNTGQDHIKYDRWSIVLINQTEDTRVTVAENQLGSGTVILGLKANCSYYLECSSTCSNVTCSCSITYNSYTPDPMGVKNYPTGGLRIKALQNYGATGELLGTLRYEYKNQQNGSSSGALNHERTMDFKKNTLAISSFSDGLVTKNRYVYQNLIYSEPTSGVYSNGVTYQYVQEYRVDKAGASNGFTEYEFSVYPDLEASKDLPLISNAWRRGQLLRSTVYSAELPPNNIAKETRNYYSTDSRVFRQAKGFLMSKYCSVTSYTDACSSDGFDVMNVYGPLNFFYDQQWMHQDSTSTTEYYENGLSSTTTTATIYDNPLHAEVTRSVTISSDGSVKTVKRKYPQDYAPTAGLDALVDRGMIGTLVEERELLQRPEDGAARTVASKVADYRVDEFGHVVPATQWTLLASTPLLLTEGVDGQGRYTNLLPSPNVTYKSDGQFKFDANGMLVDYEDKAGLKSSFTWDSKSVNLLGKAVNAPSGTWMHENFEEGGFNKDRQDFTTFKTGKSSTRACLVDWSNSRTITLEAGRKYSLSYWTKKGTTSSQARVSVSKTGLTLIHLMVTPPASGDWIRADSTFTVPSGQGGEYTVWVLSGSGNASANLTQFNYIDDIRIAPVDAQVESYTWDTGVGLTSKTDPMGLTTTYEYDGLGRLIRVRDSEGKVIQEHRYKYATEQ